MSRTGHQENPQRKWPFRRLKHTVVKRRGEKGQEQEWNLKFTIFHINSRAVTMVFIKLF